MELLFILIFYMFLGAYLIRVLSKLLFLKDKETKSYFRSFVLLPFLPLKWIFKGFKEDGFMGFWDRKKLFKSSNRGFVIDGDRKRLSLESSFQNILVTGSAGSGKSTVFIYSNIFTLAKNRQANSLIIADPKSDFIKKTSGYLNKHGYKVYSLNPTNLNHSLFFNPLLNCTSDSDIDELARIVIESSYQGYIREEDRFWINGAIKLIFIVASCLVNTRQKNIITLPNILHCLNNFGDKGKGIEKLVLNYASPKVYSMYFGLLNANENVLLSFLSTAQNALVSISVNSNIERLLSDNSFNFSDLRNKRIALFINIPPQLEDQTSFLTNLFYTQLFNSLTPIPSKTQNDVFALLDECGQYTISKLNIYTTFLRQSRVGFLNLIQDYNQLVHRYGSNKADVIANGGTSTKIYFSNPSISEAFDISRRIGTKKVYQKNGTYTKEEIMSLSDVLTMKKDEVLFFHATQKPLKLKVKRYFEVSRYRIYSSLKPYINITKTNATVSYIDLRSL